MTNNLLLISYDSYFKPIKACKRRDSIRTSLQTDKTEPDVESLKILIKCYLHLLNHLPLETLKVSLTVFLFIYLFVRNSGNNAKKEKSNHFFQFFKLPSNCFDLLRRKKNRSRVNFPLLPIVIFESVLSGI